MFFVVDGIDSVEYTTPKSSTTPICISGTCVHMMSTVGVLCSASYCGAINKSSIYIVVLHKYSNIKYRTPPVQQIVRSQGNYCSTKYNTPVGRFTLTSLHP